MIVDYSVGHESYLSKNQAGKASSTDSFSCRVVAGSHTNVLHEGSAHEKRQFDRHTCEQGYKYLGCD